MFTKETLHFFIATQSHKAFFVMICFHFLVITKIFTGKVVLNLCDNSSFLVFLKHLVDRVKKKSNHWNPFRNKIANHDFRRYQDIQTGFSEILEPSSEIIWLKYDCFEFYAINFFLDLWLLCPYFGQCDKIDANATETKLWSRPYFSFNKERKPLMISIYWRSKKKPFSFLCCTK